MDVIDEEQIGLAEPTTELSRRAILNGGDQLIRELLGAEVRDTTSGLIPEDFMCDGLHEMGLAEPSFAVDEEGVVDLAGCLGDRVCRGCRELIRLPDHEVVEYVSLT